MTTKSYSSVLRFRKISEAKDFAGATAHNLRSKMPGNADPKRRWQNKALIGGANDFLDLVNARLKVCHIKPRKNACRALEFILTAGPEFFNKIQSRDVWVKNATDFLEQRFGKANVVHLMAHFDETTPHIHAIVVPIVKANDRAKKLNKRDWKLDAKGILESMEAERKMGGIDRSAAEFRQADLTTSFRMINRLNAKADPSAAFLATKMSPAALTSMANPKLKLIEKRRILVTELNRVLAGESLFDEQVFGNVSLPTETAELKNRYPRGDDLYVLNRKLLEVLFPGLIAKCVGRRIGHPTMPYMHKLQVDYFELCQKLDKEISEPLYGARLPHQDLADFYGALKKADDTTTHLVDIKVNPPSAGEKISPEEHARRETVRLHDALEPLVALATESHLLRQEVEELKAGIRQVNRPLEPIRKKLVAENEDLQRQIAAVKADHDKLMHRLRTIPLDEVLLKLGFNQRVTGQPNQFHLPDERVIEITQSSFIDLTGRFGLGKMSERKRGKGALDLTMFVTGWDFALAQKWLGKTFGVESAVNESAEHLAKDLERKTTDAESRAFTYQPRSPFEPDEVQWRQVRQVLATERGLDPQLLDDLQRKSLIDANKAGSLVCVKLNKRSFVGGLALGLKPNPLTGTTSLYQSQDDDGYPFVIGTPQDAMAAVVSSPLEALAYFELSKRKCQVLATQSPLPPAILNGLKQRAAETGHPVFLAHSLSPEDESLAEKMKTQLESAGVPTARHQPPQFHAKANAWGDLLLTSKGKLANYAGLAQEAVQAALLKCKEWFGIDDPPAPPAAEMKPTHAPEIPKMKS